MKKVLMIVYSSPSLKYPGIERVVGFVNMLRNYGWDPLVLTPESGAGTYTEPITQVSEGIDIIRTIPWEPNGFPRFIRAAARFAASSLVPDRERLWEFFAVRKAARLAKYKGIDLVYTISPPLSAHLIGLSLKRKYPKLPWVADLCTIKAINPVIPAKSGFSAHFPATVKERYEKKLMGRIADNADYIVACNEEMLHAIFEIYSDKNRKSTASLVQDGHAQELSELFEKACRAIAVKKLENE